MTAVFEILIKNVFEWAFSLQVFLWSTPIYLIVSLAIIRWQEGEVKISSFVLCCFFAAAGCFINMVIYIALLISVVVVPMVLFGQFVWPKIKDKKLF